MKKTSKRQQLCRQIELVQLHLAVAGADGSPEASGLDVAFVREVQDLGAGNYKIVFHDKAQRNIVPVSLLVSTAGLYGRVTAVDKESITVQLATFAGVATDGDFNLSCLFHEARYLY